MTLTVTVLAQITAILCVFYNMRDVNISCSCFIMKSHMEDFTRVVQETSGFVESFSSKCNSLNNWTGNVSVDVSHLSGTLPKFSWGCNKYNQELNFKDVRPLVYLHIPSWCFRLFRSWIQQQKQSCDRLSRGPGVPQHPSCCCGPWPPLLPSEWLLPSKLRPHQVRPPPRLPAPPVCSASQKAAWRKSARGWRRRNQSHRVTVKYCFTRLFPSCASCFLAFCSVRNELKHIWTTGI